MLEATVLKNPWIPHEPTPKQAVFLTMPTLEGLFGGAAGGGKSDALLMAALQYVDVPGYSAIIFRKTYADLALPGAIMDRARSWLSGTPAKWNEQKKLFTFPSGATLTFGYLEHENDKYRYQGAEFQAVLWDELTQFPESPYRYLMSRTRRLKGAWVPIRHRAATNPGGLGHEWVMQRFIVEPTPNRIFIPSTLDDNPHLDREEYLRSLTELDSYTREQLLAGNWFAKPPGSKFRAEWFRIVDGVPAEARCVRYWDLAATEPKPGKDPDWTAGALLAEHDGRYWLCDLRRTRTTPQGVEAFIEQTAAMDGRSVPVHMEQEPGSGGVNTIDHYRRRILKGYVFDGNRATGKKELRANPVSSAAQAGNFMLVRGPWINAFLDEAVGFPGGAHDDQIDAVSGAFGVLAGVPDLPFAWLRSNPETNAILTGNALPVHGADPVGEALGNIAPASTNEDRIAARKAAYLASLPD